MYNIILRDGAGPRSQLDQPRCFDGSGLSRPSASRASAGGADFTILKLKHSANCS